MTHTKKKILNLLLFISFLFSFNNSDSISQWVVQPSGTNVFLYCVDFVNQYTGYAVGDSCTVLKTTNEGVTWNKLILVFNNGLRLEGVDFINDNTGTAVGNNLVIRTTNGGVNWAKQTSNNSHHYRVSFCNANTGILTGYYPILYLTTNGGANWIVRNVPDFDLIVSCEMVDSLTGYACGQYEEVIKTTSGGFNWFRSNGSRPGIDLLYGISFINANTGTAVGGGTIIHTTTGGGFGFWQFQPPADGRACYDVQLLNENVGFVVGAGGKINYTTNGGSNWYIQNSGVSVNLSSIFFNDIQHCTIGGGNGTILHTTSGGITPVISVYS